MIKIYIESKCDFALWETKSYPWTHSGNSKLYLQCRSQLNEVTSQIEFMDSECMCLEVFPIMLFFCSWKGPARLKWINLHLLKAVSVL